MRLNNTTTSDKYFDQGIILGETSPMAISFYRTIRLHMWTPRLLEAFGPAAGLPTLA